jgi:hypothetical protein
MVILLLQVVLGLDLFVGCFDAFVFGDKEWFGGLGEGLVVFLSVIVIVIGIGGR